MTVAFLLLISFAAALLTLVSGFGLGTVLMPCFALFFPLPEAVALTAVVHFCTNLFKIGLLQSWVNWSIWKRFVPGALVGAILGAFALGSLDQSAWAFTWKLGTVTPLGITIGTLLILFAWHEIQPFSWFSSLKSNALLGGALSGFFGGLSGNQGALRSAFLIKFKLSKESYVATGTAIAMVIDVSRIPLYAERLSASRWSEHLPVMLGAVSAAVLGAWIGKKTLIKMKDRMVHFLVGTFLLLSGVLMATGVL